MTSLIIISTNVFAKEEKIDPDVREPITIESDSAEFDNKTGQASYYGHVVMKQGSRILLSETLVITKDQEGKIKNLIAKGNPATVSAKADVDKPMTRGKAEIIEFYPKENKFVLIHKAELVQNENVIQGPKLMYDLTTKILTSEPMNHERTSVTLPSKKKGESKELQ